MTENELKTHRLKRPRVLQELLAEAEENPATLRDSNELPKLVHSPTQRDEPSLAALPQTKAQEPSPLSDPMPTVPLRVARQAVAANRERRHLHPAARSELIAGTKIAERYLIRGILGMGGTAVVYKAFDTQGKRNVAVKMLQGGATQEQQRLFRREALLASGFQHPNIVDVFDYGEHQGMCFLCMEILEGMTAYELLQQHKPKGLSMAAAFQICEGVLEALCCSHRDHLIHRDIKPSNIMLTPRREVKLMDFGTARVCEPGLRTTIAGTPAYMSPEQMHGEPLSHRADIFGFGVTMYQLLTGHLPFSGIDRSPPIPPHSHRPMPMALSILILRCIAIRPEDRPVSAKETLAMLRDCRRLLPIPSRTEHSNL